MKTSLLIKGLTLTILIIFLSACAVEPYDYTAFKAHKPRSILVIPPRNASVEVNAPYVFLSTVTKPLAEKGYYVFPVEVIDAFLKQNGLPTPDEMNDVPLSKIRQHIGADAVLYTEINDWGQRYHVLNSTTTVDAKVKLVDARTGTLLWDAPVFAEQRSDDGGGGLSGALVGAVVAQIVGSMADRTPALSKMATTNAVNNQQRGMLDGPYHKVEEKK